MCIRDSIIIVDIQDIYTKASFKYAKDVYANPQRILTIQAPNEEEFEKFVEENKKTIVDFFTRAETVSYTHLEGAAMPLIAKSVLKMNEGCRYARNEEYETACDCFLKALVMQENLSLIHI